MRTEKSIPALIVEALLELGGRAGPAAGRVLRPHTHIIGIINGTLWSILSITLTLVERVDWIAQSVISKWASRRACLRHLVLFIVLWWHSPEIGW